MTDTTMISLLVTIITQIIVAVIIVTSLKEKVNTLSLTITEMRVTLGTLSTAYAQSSLNDVRFEYRITAIEKYLETGARPPTVPPIHT